MLTPGPPSVTLAAPGFCTVLSVSPAQLADFLRGHWSIEDGLHCRLMLMGGGNRLTLTGRLEGGDKSVGVGKAQR